MGMTTVLSSGFDNIPGEAIPLLAIIGGFVVALVAIIGGFIKQITVTKHKEESRREIAAYIAEGSMSPEDGKAILEAKIKGGCHT
ncbi:MAG: hypothetical protein H6815_05760 [Phycisphaeraceae bacterium]|nr:hypothetical protein [Phycisphaerales bacterium]MCB9859944.1 hypothetical protein [Phycisphaeraceae bacterium]